MVLNITYSFTALSSLSNLEAPSVSDRWFLVPGRFGGVDTETPRIARYRSLNSLNTAKQDMYEWVEIVQLPADNVA